MPVYKNLFPVYRIRSTYNYISVSAIFVADLHHVDERQRFITTSKGFELYDRAKIDNSMLENALKQPLVHMVRYFHRVAERVHRVYMFEKNFR